MNCGQPVTATEPHDMYACHNHLKSRLEKVEGQFREAVRLLCFAPQWVSRGSQVGRELRDQIDLFLKPHHPQEDSRG